jgi:hypothetical protein
MVTDVSLTAAPLMFCSGWMPMSSISSVLEGTTNVMFSDAGNTLSSPTRAGGDAQAGHMSIAASGKSSATALRGR